MNWGSFFIGFGGGAAGMFLTLVVLVTRKLIRELGPVSSWSRRGAHFKEKVRVGETVTAVIAGANGKKRRIG